MVNSEIHEIMKKKNHMIKLQIEKNRKKHDCLEYNVINILTYYV